MKDIADIRNLPVSERLQLVGQIWESILDDPELLPVSPELLRDLQHELAEHRRDPASSIPWEEVEREAFEEE